MRPASATTRATSKRCSPRIRALDAAKIKTKGDLVFLFTTDEEAGMTGAKQYTKDNKGKVDYYIALDGGYEGFTYAGIGINWYRHHFIGPGGHTRSRTPPYSATLAARACHRTYLRVESSDQSVVELEYRDARRFGSGKREGFGCVVHG